MDRCLDLIHICANKKRDPLEHMKLKLLPQHLAQCEYMEHPFLH